MSWALTGLDWHVGASCQPRWAVGSPSPSSWWGAVLRSGPSGSAVKTPISSLHVLIPRLDFKCPFCCFVYRRSAHDFAVMPRSKAKRNAILLLMCFKRYVSQVFVSLTWNDLNRNNTKRIYRLWKPWSLCFFSSIRLVVPNLFLFLSGLLTFWGIYLLVYSVVALMMHLCVCLPLLIDRMCRLNDHKKLLRL